MEQIEKEKLNTLSVAKEMPPGTILGEKYKVISLLGHGGMGSVYKVEQMLVHQQYALKMLKADQLSDVVWRRFQKEATAASRLNHANLVRAHEFGLLDDTCPYLVMELLEGETLSQRIKNTGPLSVEEALKLFIPVCFGLDYAHQEGVVHRDLKPSNIILSKNTLGEEVPKVVDFGIAKVSEELESTSNALTKTGEIFGTPFYMSPEQCKGVNVDQRSDIYSLGCVLFEALTSTPPFHSDNAIAIITQHLSQEPPTLKAASLGTEFPSQLERVVSKMLAKEPSERYQNMEQVARDLMALQTKDETSLAAPQKMAVLDQTAPGRNQAKLAAALMLASLTSLILGMAVGFKIQPDSDQAKTSLGPAMTDTIAPYNQNPNSDARSPRLFVFPDDSIGGLTISGRKKPISMHGQIPVPAGCTLAAEMGLGDVVCHPELLMRFTEKDLDSLHLNFEVTNAHATDELADDLMVYVARLKSLTSLNVIKCPISDRGFSYISQLPNLRILSIRRIKAAPETIATCLSLPNWLVLQIDEIKHPRPLLKKLAETNHCLEGLTATECDLDSEDIDLICRIPSLNWVSVEGNERVSDADVSKFAALKNLTSLNLKGTSLTDKAIPALLKLRGMQSVVVNAAAFSEDQQHELHKEFPGLIFVRSN